VALRGVEACRSLVVELTEEALEALAPFEEAGFHRWLAKKLADREN